MVSGARAPGTRRTRLAVLPSSALARRDRTTANAASPRQATIRNSKAAGGGGVLNVGGADGRPLRPPGRPADDGDGRVVRLRGLRDVEPVGLDEQRMLPVRRPADRREPVREGAPAAGREVERVGMSRRGTQLAGVEAGY